MIEPKMITHWLTQPASVSNKDRQDVAALIDTYPYFVPTRYIVAAETHVQQAFATEMLSNMQLYRGNWLLFHEFLMLSEAKQPSTPLPQSEQETASSDEMPTHAEMATSEPDAETVVEESENQQVPATAEQLAVVEPLPTDEQDEVSKEDPYIASVPKIPEQAEVNHADATPLHQNPKNDPLIQPIYTEDYFLHQGLHVSDTLPTDNRQKQEDKSLMVVMSFSEWLLHFKTKGEKEKEEKEDQKALKTMWQKEKLAAALEEENEEIPETVFEMAVNSITKEEDLASEPLAEILERQGKHDKAIEMYRKLSLRNPQKKAYFARKIEGLQKEKGI